jgi:DNA-binding HxlR family transcriptional regulator
VLGTKPPSVEYSLTDLGRELVPAIEAIAHVGYKLRQHSLAMSGTEPIEACSLAE